MTTGRRDVFVPDWLRRSDRDRDTPTPPGAPAHLPPPATSSTGPPAGQRDTFVPDWMRAPAGPDAAHRPLLIRGAHCVIPGAGVFTLDVRVEDGRIHTIGERLSDDGCDVVGAQGKYLIPGIVDPHVHLGLFVPFEVEAFTETRSAALNGVTSMGAYVISEEPYADRLDAVIESLDRHAVADVFLHLSIFNQAQLAEIPILAARYGVRSFKAYMTGIPGLMPSLDEGFLLDLMAAVADVGPDAVLNIHAENYHIVDWATARLKRAHPGGVSLEQWSETHPAFSESEAIQRAVLLAEQSGVRIYIVHVSSAEGVETVRRLKRDGKRFWAETTSPYLTLSNDSPMGALAKMVPPIRSAEDQAALWQGLIDDVLDTVGTDHTPMTIDEKQARAANLWDTMPGYPAVGTHVPSLIDAARRHDLSLLRLVEKLALNPARIFGLYPRKGTLLPGSDADLVIVDPMRERDVTADTAASRSDFALHQGERLIGWPVAVFKGGRPVRAEDLREARSNVSGGYLRR